MTVEITLMKRTVVLARIVPVPVHTTSSVVLKARALTWPKYVMVMGTVDTTSMRSSVVREEHFQLPLLPLTSAKTNLSVMMATVSTRGGSVMEKMTALEERTSANAMVLFRRVEQMSSAAFSRKVVSRIVGCVMATLIVKMKAMNTVVLATLQQHCLQSGHVMPGSLTVVMANASLRLIPAMVCWIVGQALMKKSATAQQRSTM